MDSNDIILLLLLNGALLSQDINTINAENETTDSSEMNFRLIFGGNYYKRVENSYHMDILRGHGGNVGFLFTITKQFEIEGDMAFYKFDASYGRNIDYKLKANINNLGLRIYPYNQRWKVYTGLMMSWDNFTEYLKIKEMHLEKDSAPHYESISIPVGIVYDLSKHIALDFSIRPGLTYPDFILNRIIFGFNFIFDIKKSTKE